MCSTQEVKESHGHPTSIPFFFSYTWADVDNEEAVRQMTCCMAVALGAFRFPNTSCSFSFLLLFVFTIVLFKLFLPHMQLRSRRMEHPVTGPEIIDVSSHCSSPLPSPDSLLLPQRRQISFFGLPGKSQQRRRVKMFSIKCDWIGFYKMNCPDRGLSQLQCREVLVPPQPLRSAAIRVDFELLGSVIVSPAYCVSGE